MAILGLGDSGLFRALSSQLDFVGLHLLGSMVFEGLEGGVLSSCFDAPAKLSCSPVLTPIGVCVREAGSEGLTNTSFVVDMVEVVMLLLMEFPVPGRSCVSVALL